MPVFAVESEDDGCCVWTQYSPRFSELQRLGKTVVVVKGMNHSRCFTDFLQGQAVAGSAEFTRGIMHQLFEFVWLHTAWAAFAQPAAPAHPQESQSGLNDHSARPVVGPEQLLAAGAHRRQPRSLRALRMFFLHPVRRAPELVVDVSLHPCVGAHTTCTRLTAREEHVASCQ